jgi:hypothetical protein
MGKMKDFAMDIEDFCNGYFYGFIDQPMVYDEEDFTIEEVVEDVQEYFKSEEAAKYAREYIKRTVEGA